MIARDALDQSGLVKCPARWQKPVRALARRLEQAGLRFLLDQPEAVLRSLSWSPSRGRYSGLDPQIRMLLALLDRVGSSELGRHPIVKGRERMRRYSLVHTGPFVPVRKVENLTLPGPAGPLEGRHYCSSSADLRPLLLYFHGGGFVAGDLDTHDAACRRLCRSSRVDVLSIAYRLAPEHRFPAAIEDAHSAWDWIWTMADDLGVDPGRIAIGGDSAGANLATVLCQQLRNRDDPCPSLQFLLNPLVDRAVAYDSLDCYGKGLFLTRSDLDWFMDQYLEEDGPPLSDPRVSPLRGELVGLPPAIVVVSEFDPLRGEGEAFAAALAEAGVEVVLERVAGMIHGLVFFAGVSKTAQAAIDNVAGILRQQMMPPDSD